MASNKSMLSSDEITNILKEKQKNIKYDTKDWSIELVLSKFHKQTEKNQTEINIPFIKENLFGRQIKYLN